MRKKNVREGTFALVFGALIRPHELVGVGG